MKANLFFEWLKSREGIYYLLLALLLVVVFPLALDSFLGYVQLVLELSDVTAWMVAMFSAWWLAKRSLDTEEALAMYAYETHGPGKSKEPWLS